MGKLIEVKNLHKLYKMGDELIRALDGVNFTIEEGHVVCIVGKSGSGKSTLLNTLAGLEKPTKGEIIVGGINIEKLNEAKITKFRQLNVGFVFQSYNLIPTLTALENVSLGLTFKGVHRKKRDLMAKEILEKVGLGNRVYHKPNQLSGGQQQRVSIARAFVDFPKIIFADEPTGNLDSKTTIEIMELITSMVKKSNQTLIIVTHDDEITCYADIIFRMKDGKIEKVENRRYYEEKNI